MNFLPRSQLNSAYAFVAMYHGSQRVFRRGFLIFE